ncbi:MAG: serine/threonine-protein phosphatase [Reyranella sp.]|nr:serine/threonine-protein phosphatase [Reyranella sp.]
MAGRWRGGGSQHRGAPPYQEDRWRLATLGDGSLLAVVADGMGGHAGGATASRLAVEAFVHAIEQGGGLADGLGDANAAVGKGAAGKSELAGMGATLVGVHLRGDELRWISVGDSPFYLVEAGRIERLNADHSMAPQIDALVKRGMLSQEEADRHPGRHTLREAVMGEPLTLIDKGSRQLGPDARLLVCSDGVQSLTPEQIMGKVSLPPDRIIAAVLAARKEHQDNITVVKLERAR